MQGAYMQRKSAYMAHVTRAQRGQAFTPLRGPLTTGNPLWNGDQRGQNTEGVVGKEEGVRWWELQEAGGCSPAADSRFLPDIQPHRPYAASLADLRISLTINLV